MNTYARCFLYCLVAFTALLVLLQTASAVDCGNPGSPTPLFWLQMNESTGGVGTTIYDACGTNHFSRNSTTENVTSVWTPGQDFEVGDKDQFYNYSAEAMGFVNSTSVNNTLRAMFKPESMTALQILFTAGNSTGGTDRGRYTRLDVRADDYARCLCGYGTGTYEISATGILQAGSWYDLACVYNGSRLAIWVNGTYNTSVATPSGCSGSNDSVLVGTWDGSLQYPADGVIDEVAYWQTALNSTQINALWVNNTINEPAASPTSIGCSVAITSPAAGNRTNDSTPTITGSLTCYQGMAGNCSLYMNATASGINSTLSNGTSFEITANSTKADDRYDYYLTCSNGSVSNSSSNQTLYIDTVPPSVAITYPTNTTYNTSVSLVLNFTYTENNTGTCWYNLNGGSNTTIGYVNSTGLLTPAGAYTVYLWCNDTAGNYDTDSESFTVQTNTSLSASETTPYLVTKGMNRTFQALYAIAGATNATGNFSLGNCVAIPGSGSSSYTHIDWINSTHYAIMDTSGIGVYLLSGGARVSACAISAIPTGLYCRNGATCYIAYATSVYTIDLNTCVRSLEAIWTLGGSGFVINRGMAQRSDGKWWVGASSAATTVVSYPALLNSDFTLNTILNGSLSNYLYGRGFDGVSESFFYATNDTSNHEVFQFRESDGDRSGHITLSGPSIRGDIMLLGNRLYGFDLGTGFGGLQLCYADVNFSSTVSGASCTLDYGGSSVSMVASGGHYAASVIENYSDHGSFNAVITCTKAGYLSQTTTVSVNTHNWITPENINTGAAYTTLQEYSGSDFDAVDDLEGVNVSGMKKCTRFQLEGNSLSTINSLNLYHVFKDFSVATSGGITINLTVHPVVVGTGVPDTGTTLASCGADTPSTGVSYADLFVNCSSLPTANMTLDTYYYICTDYPIIAKRGYGLATGNAYYYSPGYGWVLIEKEYGLTVVTENTAAAVRSNISGYAVYGFVIDCANQTGLQGVTVLVSQHNSTQDFTYTTSTDATGYFVIGDMQPNLTAQISYTLEPYAGVTETFVLTEAQPTWDGSTCLALSGTPMKVDSTWILSSNDTAEIAYAVSHSDWKPNVTFKKDTLIMGVQFVVTSGGEPALGLALNGSVATTSCSYAVPPSEYAFFELGEGHYVVLARISGSLTQNFYAFCQDGDYFDINYLGAGLNAHARIDFQAYQMRASNVQLMVDDATLVNATFCNYTWVYAVADLYQDTGDNRNVPMSNLSCSARLEFYGANTTSWEVATITDNHAAVNFTSPSSKPVATQVHWNCTSPGFDYFDQIFTIAVGEDAFVQAACWIADANGYQLDVNKLEQQINHWCSFRTFKNASLLNMKVKSDSISTNTQRVFAYSYDQANVWYFSTGLFYDDMPKGLNQWDVTLTSYPTDIFPGVITYYQFVKVYSTPPSKVSPDYCDNTNCPKAVYKGETYYCKVQTTFEADFTNIVSGIKLNGTNTLYSIKATDTIINTANHVHETSFSVPAMGEKDQYGISGDTTIQCYFELYIDAERLVYGETPTQMLTKFRAAYPNDIMGFQRGWNEFANQQDKTSWLFTKIAGIPGWFFASIHVTDANGNVNAILLVVYLIAFALIVALALVWTTRRR